MSKFTNQISLSDVASLSNVKAMKEIIKENREEITELKRELALTKTDLEMIKKIIGAGGT
jgi:polyribonucleotide nucleotidyltransferase